MLRKTLAAYPWIEPAYLLSDRGYDSQANHRFLAEQGITPVIHIRKPTAADGLRDGIYTARASPPAWAVGKRITPYGSGEKCKSLS